MSTRCGIDLDPCLTLPPTDRIYKWIDTETLRHSKTIEYKINLGVQTIPLRIRKRTFLLDESSNKEKSNFILINDLQNNELECFDWKGDFNLKISENFESVDSDVYILDTERKHAFWKEVKVQVSFNKTSTDSARFNAPSNLYHKWILNSINANITTTWKLCINGNVEILFTEAGTKSLYSVDHPLIIVWPIPTAGICVDTEINNYGYFYDYFGQGEDLIISDGGADFYYPEWIRMATVHREEDQADAQRRYDYIWGADPNRKPSYTLPLDKPRIYGADDPRGSIVTDIEGNTFASVTVTKGDGTIEHFNRLYDKEGKYMNIPDNISGNNKRYYPICLT